MKELNINKICRKCEHHHIQYCYSDERHFCTLYCRFLDENVPLGISNWAKYEEGIEKPDNCSYFLEHILLNEK